MSDMEVDMVIDEVAGMEADKVGDMMVKIPDEGFTDVTLTIDGIYDVLDDDGGDKVADMVVKIPNDMVKIVKEVKKSDC